MNQDEYRYSMTEMALRVVAGYELPHTRWEWFYAKPRPEQLPTETEAQYVSRVNQEVLSMAISYLARRIDGEPG